ncbi:unnamed protein product [Cyprideis torosa]|uniref:Uncharacterized protein n=1 Tax=Cyprideis torosa TaxID=163714 RepID=A0A7R8WR43_9CRUS|nr:unnamed protein product [Cyprideis torosa]CAG0903229.1 unnamed protein product [Cyprideis torosa]
MDFVINISMVVQVVINLTSPGGPSPHTRERRQRRTANVLGVRRREIFRRRQLSAQGLRGGAVVDQRPSVIPLPCPPNMMEEEVVRSSVERSPPIPLPSPPAIISNGDEEEAVRSSVETSSAVSTEGVEWEHGVSTPFSPSPVHQAGEWEQGVDTPHSPSPSHEERVNIKQEPITPAESPTPSSTDGEEKEEEEVGAEGFTMKEEVDTPVASPSTFSDGCLSYIQSVTQAWTSMEEEGNVEVGYTTPTSTSRQPPLLPTPPPAPRRERSSHQYDNIQPRRLSFNTTPTPHSIDFDSTNTPAGNIIVVSLTAFRNSQRYYNDVYAVVDDFCRTLRQTVTTSTSTTSVCLDVTGTPLRLNQKTSQVFNSPSPTPEGRHIPLQITSRGRKGKRALRYPSSLPLPPPSPPQEWGTPLYASVGPEDLTGVHIPLTPRKDIPSPLQIASRGRKRGRRGKRALRYPSSLPHPPPSPPKSGNILSLGLGSPCYGTTSANRLFFRLIIFGLSVVFFRIVGVISCVTPAHADVVSLLRLIVVVFFSDVNSISGISPVPADVVILLLIRDFETRELGPIAVAQ